MKIEKMKSNKKSKQEKNFVSTRNPCKLCTPLGASLAFSGIKKAIPILHGSQGCATYIRRYIISHFKEPVDIASSSFTEATAVFGGGDNLKIGLENVIKQYNPEVIGIATTCLSETIGDPVPKYVDEFITGNGYTTPAIIHVSTPSYNGTHIDGFHGAVKSIVEQVAENGEEIQKDHITLFPGFVSPADIRYIKEILFDFNLNYILIPDYSETLDGVSWNEYKKIPDGGTPINDIKDSGASQASIEFGRILNKTEETAGKILKNKFNVPDYPLGLPIGINETDKFLEIIEEISGRKTPKKYNDERGRLIDSYIDGHKYLFDKKAIVYGEEDLVVGIASFLSEIGIKPVVCASGGKSGYLEECIKKVVNDSEINIMDGVDFMEIAEVAEEISPDILIGNSKGYSIARKLNIPLIRIGFPIHDRIGGQRILHLGYRGAQELFDTLTNAIIQNNQDNSPVGYIYM